MNKFQNENKLLIESAKYPLSSRNEAIFEQLVTPSLDWRYLLETANRHGIRSHLFLSLNQTYLKKQIPEPVFEALRHGYAACLYNNVRLLREFAPVHDLMNEHGVKVIVLKGPALCATIYEDFALRPYGDIDILVPKGQVKLCRQLLEERGYGLAQNIYFPLRDEENESLGCEWVYQSSNAIVEVHWGLLNKLTPFNIDIDSFWKDAKEANIDGKTISVLSPENQLLHLCLHQFTHLWDRLRDLVDIALTLDIYKEKIDWLQFIEQAHRQELGPCVYYNFLLANKVLGVDISPIPMHMLLKRPRPSRAAEITCDLVAAHILEQHLPRRFWGLLMVDQAKKKAQLARQIINKPIPRAPELRGQVDPFKSASFAKKAGSAIGSLYFYRKLLFDLSCGLLGRKKDPIKKLEG